MRFAKFAGILLLLICTRNAHGAVRVDVILNEVQPRSVPWPVTTGVPFPRGGLLSVENCRLIDDTGTEVLLQAKPTAKWDGPTGSIRWLTVDFIAAPGRKYAMEFGGDVARKKMDSPLHVDKTNVVRVQTGAIALDFPAEGICPNNFRVGNVSVATGAFSSYLDHEKRSADTRASKNQIVIEESGPVRACVRLDRPFLHSDGKRQVDCRTRYHFYAGLGLVKVVHEIRFDQSTKDTRWQSFDFNLGLQLDPNSWQVAVDASGEPGNQIVQIKPTKETVQVSSYQSVYRHYGNPECRAGIAEMKGTKETELRGGEQAGECLQVKDSKVAVTGSMRWFGQQFPVEWQARPDRLTLRLWSPRGGELDFSAQGIKRFFGEAGDKYLTKWRSDGSLRTANDQFFFTAGQTQIKRNETDGMGIHKHHEFYLHFAPAAEAASGEEYGRLVAHPPLALASGAWNASTQVMGPIAARPNDSPYEAIVDRLFDMSRQMQDTFGDYGWWLFGAGPHYSYQWDAKTGKHYADPRRFEYHTYQRETQQWWNYLRSGERKFFDWALPAENHWVDIAVSHAPTRFHAEYRGGVQSPANLHWPRGDWAIDSTVHYLRHHDNAEAWLRGQSQFWGTYHRTLETTTLAYYLTGDERFQDILEYWRSYYSNLAGKTSDSKDFQPWHREQGWCQPTPAGSKPKTWAEMIRDYAPFNSGSRHQLTLLFNLSTLYENTWDPKIGQVVKEYADAFLDPDAPIGVWRSQENRNPASAEAPIMAHYWIPALWRYARATNDPRMPKVFDRFKASLLADPFHEDVGVYSNSQIGYAYAFSKDPRHLRAAMAELTELKPNAEPLAQPEDLNMRLYNPFAPIASFAGVPRLIWVVEEAKRNSVKIPPPAITYPQRAPLVWKKTTDGEAHLSLWGFDREIALHGPDGKPVRDLNIQTTRGISAMQPFDRNLPDFEVFAHEVVVPKSAPPGWYTLVPRLEMAIVELHGGEAAWCFAIQPVAIHPHVSWFWKVPENVQSVQMESGSPRVLRIVAEDGKPVSTKLSPTGLTLSFAPADAGRVIRIENKGKVDVWFRLANVELANGWVATSAEHLRSAPPAPTSVEMNAELPKERFISGRFGKAVLIRPGMTLALPDHQKVEGAVKQFFDTRQGTLEFWIKMMWDPRLRPVAKIKYITNGLIDATVPEKLPYQEWAHVALVWRPSKTNPEKLFLHVYVNGIDHEFYRNINWEGYSRRPMSLAKNGKWLEQFVGKAPPGTAFAIDELRLSSIPRYADLTLEFGSRQAINTYRFERSREPFRPDDSTLLLFHFDENLDSDPLKNQPVLKGKILEK